jgi:release factor glutamine methyltransferase
VVATVSDVLSEARDRLATAGVGTPRLDAEILLAFALGCSRTELVMRARDAVPGELDRYWELIARREAREPVAYIIGSRDFRRLALCVDRRVLIPRPETELLVEVGLTLEPGTAVVDVGTGSGAVALALKDERPDLRVTGLDVSEGAIAVARANAQRLGLDVRFERGDLLEDAGGPFDAVLANLPYVDDDAALEPEILEFEPRGALFAGPDGLDLIRRLVGQVAGVGVVALEIGAGQADEVAALLAAAGFASVDRMRDLAGIERVVVGRR